MMTVRQFLRATVLCASIAGTQSHAIDAALFPGADDIPEEQIRLHGLAQLFPGRVLFSNPTLKTTTQSRVATRVEDLPRDIKYIRVYRLDEAESVLAEYQSDNALILDLRFLKSEQAAVDTFSTFSTKTWADQLTTLGTTPDGLITESQAPATPRTTPIVVLCNRETAGPFEAVLHQLQQIGAIIAVGEPTAGRTGFYQAGAHQSWILEGELRPDKDTSLIGSGFQPRIQLDVDPEENYLSYQLYEAGTSLLQLLRQEDYHNANSLQAELDHDDRAFLEIDRVLQRGVDTLTALQILQQQPEL